MLKIRKKTRKIKRKLVKKAKHVDLFFHSHRFRLAATVGLVILAFAFGFTIFYLGQNYVPELTIKNNKIAPNPWEDEVRKIVKDSPMEVMIPYIARKDKKTAAFLVSIAKKESNLGKRSPQLEGQDCYNYWGFRENKGRVTPSGYTCFSSPKEAVKRVSARLNELIYDAKLDTPQKMVVWKCGYDCSWDNPVSVKKWISDVNFYYQKFNE